MPKLLLTILVLLSNLFLQAQATSKPKVRAITAFVNITAGNYRAELKKFREVLGQIQKDYETAGYEVQSVRITTQPFPAYVRGMSHADELKFLQELDTLSIEGKYDFNIGPAMMNDGQDPAMMELLAETLSSTKNLVASAHRHPAGYSMEGDRSDVANAQVRGRALTERRWQFQLQRHCDARAVHALLQRLLSLEWCR